MNKCSEEFFNSLYLQVNIHHFPSEITAKNAAALGRLAEIPPKPYKMRKKITETAKKMGNPAEIEANQAQIGI